MPVALPDIVRKPRRTIVFGGRDFTDKEWLFEALDAHHAAEPFECIIEGGQVSFDREDAHLPWDERRKWGADWFAGLWAESRGVRHFRVKADWRKYGKAAGPIRNQRMIDEYEPTEGIGFPGGRGTRDMLDRIIAAGLDWITLHRSRPGSSPVRDETRSGSGERSELEPDEGAQPIPIGSRNIPYG